MSKRLKQAVVINNETHWVTADSTKGLLDSYLKLCIKQGIVVPAGEVRRQDTPLFGEYMDSFFSMYKTNQSSNTIVNRRRIIKNHIRPKFGDVRINKITTDDCQVWFNDLATRFSHETILKIKNTMSPVFDAAVEDDLIRINPLRSNKLVLNGAETIQHKSIPKHTMNIIRRSIDALGQREAIMCAVLSTTGMRFEEVLGLRWEDIDFDNGQIHIQRAVVHPTRNKPEVKDPKTKTSNRMIPLPDLVRKTLIRPRATGFLLYKKSDATRETPLSYTEARKSFNKIREQFHIEEYSAHDFRDTCATEWRESGVSIDIIARLLGHAKSETTERRYVKYRTELFQDVRTIMDNM